MSGAQDSSIARLLTPSSVAVVGASNDEGKIGNALLRHLMLLFIPAVTGVMMYFDRIAQEWLPFMASCLLGAALTMVATALTLRWMLRITGTPHDHE